MLFLQPWILFALPLIGLPVLIHLLNQRRHKSIQWGAMLFLHQAQRMNRGMAKLKQWLILGARMLCIAALVLTLSRPLAMNGVAGLLGRSSQTTLVLLDRSPSMEYRDPRTGQSKRAAALARLDKLLSTAETTGQIFLIDSATRKANRLPPGMSLSAMAESNASAVTADLPDLMGVALNTIRNNGGGMADIWICSDMQRSDWDIEGGRWPVLQQEIEKQNNIHLKVLSFADQEQTNLAIQTDRVEKIADSDTCQLIIDIRLIQTSGPLNKRLVPITFQIGDARTTFELEMTGRELVRTGLTIPIDREMTVGAGQVILPDDANSQDNSYHFVFADPAVQRSVVVSNEEPIAAILQLAASTSTSPRLACECQRIPVERAQEIDWQNTGLILWQAPMPTGDLADRLHRFVKSGRAVIFFPDAANEPVDAALFGNVVEWGGWQESETDEPFLVERWTTDTDLLRHAVGGEKLPLDSLRISKVRMVQGDALQVLAEVATLKNTANATGERKLPLLAKLLTERGDVYFCSTLPSTSHSNLSEDGIVLYVMIQRALAKGTRNMGKARSFTAGIEIPEDLAAWKPANALSESVLPSERGIQAGAYRDRDRVIAVNRNTAENDSISVDAGRLEALLSGVSLSLIADDAGQQRSLASEIWKVFVVAMLVAIFAEGILSLPHANANRRNVIPRRDIVATSSLMAKRSLGGKA